MHEDDSLSRFQNVHWVVSRKVCVHMKPQKTQENYCSICHGGHAVRGDAKLPQSTKESRERCFLLLSFQNQGIRGHFNFTNRIRDVIKSNFKGSLLAWFVRSRPLPAHWELKLFWGGGRACFRGKADTYWPKECHYKHSRVCLFLFRGEIKRNHGRTLCMIVCVWAHP